MNDEEFQYNEAVDNDRCQCGHKRKNHRVKGSTVECSKCFEKSSSLNFMHDFADPVIPDALAPRPEPGVPLAVVYEAGGKAREVLVPSGAAVSVVQGGILVQHEDFEVARLLSVRQLIPGEAHAAEDHE